MKSLARNLAAKVALGHTFITVKGIGGADCVVLITFEKFSLYLYKRREEKAPNIFMRGSFIYVTTSVTEISLGKSEGRVWLFLVMRCLRQRNISMKVQRLCCTQDGRLTLLHMASRDKQHKPTRPEPEQSCVVSHYHYLGTTMSTSSFPPANWSAHMVHC